MSEPRPRLSRAEQRRATEARILAAAGRLFAESGYDQTTIRAIAGAAEVDGGLVMHYFGSKEELFHRATQAGPVRPVGGTPEEVAEQILAQIADSLVNEPIASLAVLRSMLTHAGASEAAIEGAARYRAQLSDAIPADDADVRAALISATLIGVAVSRHFLKFDVLRDTPPEQIIDLLRPCLRSLTRADD
ncbi:TetR family transcriptional regulator [Streptosporangium sp. NPDC000239]|uniref:TetR/AcrR family transcriptional regulator n=1 Tax=Streptosporangium jomthongense TaxID=1193683 RepID=A0ABV8EQL7_9ACTN